MIKVGAQVFPGKEYSNPRAEKKYKLSPTTEGPFPVREAKEDTLVLERGDGTHERVSRDRVVLALTVVDNDNPSVVPHGLPLTSPHGVNVPSQLSHPDRRLAELQPPNEGDQLRPSGVYTRPTSKYNHVSNCLNQGSTGTVTLDFTS